MNASIHLGTQLVAPQGYVQLEKGVTYYFLCNEPGGLAVLIEYVLRPSRPRKKGTHGGSRIVQETPTPIVQRVTMPSCIFEDGLMEEMIVLADTQARLPPWLAELEGLDLSRVDGLRRNPKKLHGKRIDRQLEIIYPLVRIAKTLIAATDCDQIINKHARAWSPQQNETRTRLAFYAYLLSGCDRFALHYPIQKIGHWCRAQHASHIKRGRPSERKGKGHGHNATPEMIQSIVDCYMRERGPGVDLATIYQTFMNKDLGCKECSDHHGRLTYRHPDGKPFPTRGMFVYYVHKELGTAEVQRSLLGSVRLRSRIAAQLGAFTQNTCNVLERVERDAYALKELPRGLIEGHTLPPLYVVRSRDVASGLILGIGFSQGSETSAAYRMELFCRAVDKVKFCQLFGLDITPEQWPSSGLAMHEVQDRGVGSTDGAFARDQDFKPVIRELPPSYAGQSKAVIESSHPKDRTTDDAPTHVKSDKRTFELARREIARVLLDNDTINVGDRIPPDLLEYVRKPTPVALYQELDRRGRSDALPMDFANAVRTFLSKCKAKVTRKGLDLHSQLYASAALLESGLLDRANGPQERWVEVYVLDSCVRHIWVDVIGRLVELDVQMPMRVGNELLYLSLQDLKEREAFIRRRNLAHQEHRDARTSRSLRNYEEESGKPWGGATRIAGRPKRGGVAAKLEAAEAKAAMRPR